MAENIEIKAQVDSLAEIERRVIPLADSGPEELVQEDTFFRAAHGRLKLRLFPDGHGELIGYHRANEPGPKLSEYLLVRVEDGRALRQLLATTLETTGQVNKRRLLYLVGPTRVHLDRVDGLGDFVELETVLRPGESHSAGQAATLRLMEQLGIERSRLIDKAYVDLIERC